MAVVLDLADDGSDSDAVDELTSQHLPIPFSLQARATQPSLQPIKQEPGYESLCMPQVWPTDFYVVDIIACFDEVRSARAGKKTKDIFKHHFSVSLKQSTFYDHHGHWDLASFDMKQKVLDVGHSAAGLWSVFMDSNCAPQTELKAVCKQTLSAQHQSVSSFIDLTL